MAAVDADAAEAINDVRNPSAADPHPDASTPPTEPQPSATGPDATQESAQDPRQESAQDPAQEDEYV
jgi:hypothetical protein